MELGHLARDQQLACAAEGLLHVGHALGDAMRRLVEHHRGALVGELAQRRRTRPALGRQEADEAETALGEARHGQGRHRRTRPGQRHHRMPRGAHPRHQAGARVRHRRRTGVGDQRHLTAGGELGDDRPGGLLLVVLVYRQHARANAVRIEQALAVAGVLGGHHIDRGEHGERTQRDVMQVSERRSHHIQ